jgi:hypothetical protein
MLCYPGTTCLGTAPTSEPTGSKLPQPASIEEIIKQRGDDDSKEYTEYDDPYNMGTICAQNLYALDDGEEEDEEEDEEGDEDKENKEKGETSEEKEMEETEEEEKEEKKKKKQRVC